MSVIQGNCYKVKPAQDENEKKTKKYFKRK